MHRAHALWVVLIAATIGYLASARAAESSQERWTRGEAWYGKHCALTAAGANETYTECVSRLLAANDSDQARLEASRPRVDPDSLEGRLTRAYGERCALAGYTPGTGAFGQCLLAYYDRWQQAEQARRAAELQIMLGVYNAQRANPQQPNLATVPQFRSMPVPTLRMCTSIVGNQIITTNCY